MGHAPRFCCPGKHGSEESKQEYERLLTQLRANNNKLPDRTPSSDLTCAELAQRFMQEHVEPHYRHQDGIPTAERRDYIYTLKPFVRLFANKPAHEFTPLELRAY